MEAAGLRVQFHYNLAPGIHFRVPAPENYLAAIIRGIEGGMAARFPEFPKTGSIWIVEITDRGADSSEQAFYKAGRAVIDQAYSLTQCA